MIMEANVGVGISGKEGMQVSRKVGISGLCSFSATAVCAVLYLYPLCHDGYSFSVGLLRGWNKAHTIARLLVLRTSCWADFPS